MQQARIEKASIDNETIAETINDKNRRIATESERQTSSVEKNEASILSIDPTYYKILNIDPHQPITEKIIQDAFTEQIKIFHPDNSKNGSNEIASHLIKARQAMLAALRNKETGKRYFSTKRIKPIDNSVKEPPRSIYHPRARVLIDTILIEKNYEKAVKLVEEEEIHPDSHDKGENTLLVTLVKDDRGTLKDIEFAIDTLGASIDSSCDCPAHRTSLHYGALGNKKAKVELLLKKGANPNLITSFGETALDLAIMKGHQDLANYIRSKGGVQHKTLQGSESLWKSLMGYSSSERTLLLKKKRALEDSEEVIHLPPQNKN